MVIFTVPEEQNHLELGGSCWRGCLRGLPEPRERILLVPCQQLWLPSAARRDTLREGIITWTLLSGFLSVFRWRHPERAFRVNCHLKTFLQVNSLAYFGCLHLPLQLIYRLLDFTVRAFFVLSFCLFYLDKPFCLFVWFFYLRVPEVTITSLTVYPTHLVREGKWKRLLSAGVPWRFHFELGPLLLPAAVAVNWKCQTCRLTVASRVCVINRTSHGTPNERVVSIRTETDPTIGQTLKK